MQNIYLIYSKHISKQIYAQELLSVYINIYIHKQQVSPKDPLHIHFMHVHIYVYIYIYIYMYIYIRMHI